MNEPDGPKLRTQNSMIHVKRPRCYRVHKYFPQDNGRQSLIHEATELRKILGSTVQKVKYVLGPLDSGIV